MTDAGMTTRTALQTTAHISIDTPRSWEQGRRRPRGAALALIRIVARDPRVLRLTLSSSTGAGC